MIILFSIPTAQATGKNEWNSDFIVQRHNKKYDNKQDLPI